MAKGRGRPGVPYEKFVEVWEQLVKEGRAGTNTALDILGGNKSTIISFRERYEREKSSREISIVKSVELTEAVHRAIAEIKVKEIELLEKTNAQLKTRIDDYLTTLREAEEKLAAAYADLEDTKTNFEIEKLNLERKLAAAQAKAEDMEKREQRSMEKYEQLNEQYNQAKQEAAVARKEIEMLREQEKKK